MTQHDKYLCFGCKAILAGTELASSGNLTKGTRCPHCAHLLIVNTGPVALGSSEITRLFRLQRTSIWNRRQRLPGMTLALTRAQTPPPLPVSVSLSPGRMKAMASANATGRRPPPFHPGPKVAAPKTARPPKIPRLKVAP